LLEFTVGQKDLINSITIKNGFLVSSSFDGSIRLWNTARGVELKYFKEFDDKVIFCVKTPSLVAIANFVIRFSFTTKIIQKMIPLSQNIISRILQNSFIHVATKNATSITIHILLLPTLVPQSELSTSIKDSCSAFYADNLNFIFWFVLRNGNFLRYSLTGAKFVLEVSMELPSFY
jgi:WD40 repeat protein